MKRILFGITAIAALVGTPALAADMPLKAPPSPSVLGFSWTGFYMGAALGAKWADTTWNTTSITEIPLASFVDASSPRSYDPSGIRGGIYLGYNWQLASQWIGGIEFDWADANKTVTTAGVPGCSILCFTPFVGPGVDTSSVKMGWDASARGRLGYLLSPSLLIYGTGGIAWQNITSSATCQNSAPDPMCEVAAGTPFETASNSVTRTGWTIGSGVDARISGNWILRAEYRYSYFGTWNNQASLSNPGFAPTIVDYQLKISTQIATVGVAYKFGL
jgi:outer membrane immunogenic protein